ncbi:hypothetical protein XELAEV_18021951mg [Xenopus laevis]|uniref:40S ribosomal protein S2 n=1 Tax=Xenopus laevis TaxID=8355 RepID=A0A974D2I3_XENLA|nr:hypothetical protein XELAEV_18021951mg [Xenopus laevis]
MTGYICTFGIYTGECPVSNVRMKRVHKGHGRGRGRGRGRRARGGQGLVKDMKIKSLEEIYLFSLAIKESEIIDFFLGSSLKDGRTRFKAFVAIGDYNCHVGLSVKCSKEVSTAIWGAIIQAKLSIIPVRRGFWGNKISKSHTVPCKEKLLLMAGIDDCYTSARGNSLKSRK